MIMDDCKFYNPGFSKCMALKEVYCKKEECSFYKPKGREEKDHKGAWDLEK